MSPLQILSTLIYLEPDACSEPCKAFKMERFAFSIVCIYKLICFTNLYSSSFTVSTSLNAHEYTCHRLMENDFLLPKQHRRNNFTKSVSLVIMYLSCVLLSTLISAQLLSSLIESSLK